MSADFQTVAGVARSLRISRPTVHRYAKEFPWIRNERGRIDLPALRDILNAVAQLPKPGRPLGHKPARRLPGIAPLKTFRGRSDEKRVDIIANEFHSIREPAMKEEALRLLIGSVALNRILGAMTGNDRPSGE